MRCALMLALTTVACGTTDPWTTFHSASCDSTFELFTLPASNRNAENTYFGDSFATAHGIDRPDGSRFVYGCRTIPAGYWAARAEQDVAREVLDGELTTFDNTWTRGPIENLPDGTLHIVLSNPQGKAEMRVRGIASDTRTHGSIVKFVKPEERDRFLAGIRLDPPHATEPVTVRSAECLSSVTMPGWPIGEVVDPIFTHRFIEGGGAREWQLRCAFFAPNSVTPAELFDHAEADMKTLPVTLASKKDVTVDGRPGRDLFYESNDKTRAIALRIVVEADKVHTAYYLSPLGESKAAATYFATFHLLMPKAK